MPERPPPNRTAENRGPRSGAFADLDQSPWRQLTEAASAEELSANWLELQSRLLGGVTGGLVVLDSAETGTFAPAGFLPRGQRDSAGLAPVVERALRERKGVVVRSDAQQESQAADDLCFHLAFPVQIGDTIHGAAAFAITPRPPIQLQAAMRQLQWGVAWLQNWFLRRAAEPLARKRLSTALEMAALVLEQERFQGAAIACVTELATRLQCDRVSLGFLRGRYVRVVALSHSAQFEKQMNLIRSIGRAMGESVDQRSALRYPPRDPAGVAMLHCHEQLARDHGDGAVFTVPFSDSRGDPLGALTLERSGSAPFDRETEEMADAVAALVGPILEEKRRNNRLLVSKIGASLWAQIQALIGAGHTIHKLVGAGLLGLAVFLAVARGDHRVKARTLLEGEVRRVVVAPYDGFVGTALARAGDVVREGQVLCTLDDRDLRLEQGRLSSEREQYVVEHRRSMAEGKAAAMGVVSKKMNQTEAQLALLAEQIARARIVAPFDGLVTSGDLSQSLGAPVETGQVLFEVAPLDSYRLILKVDERDVGYLAVGQTGDLILTALPGTRHGFEVAKITPVSESEEGGSFFRVEARLDQVSDRLRPGMEGFAKVDVGRARLVWIWTRDLVDWIRLKIWAWLP